MDGDDAEAACKSGTRRDAEDDVLEDAKVDERNRAAPKQLRRWLSARRAGIPDRCRPVHDAPRGECS